VVYYWENQSNTTEVNTYYHFQVASQNRGGQILLRPATSYSDVSWQIAAGPEYTISPLGLLIPLLLAGAIYNAALKTSYECDQGSQFFLIVMFHFVQSLEQIF
jgi:hypothetical protein